jgi:hypothetical protein
MWWGRSPYIFMFPWKYFLMGRTKKIQKHNEDRDKLGKFKKTRRKEWKKKEEEIFTYAKVPYLCVLHWLRMPLGYRPYVTLPQENPLVWEPPLQHNFHDTYVFCKHGWEKFQNYMEQKLSHFQVYGYCRVVVNVLKNTLSIIVHEQYIPCITTIYMEVVLREGHLHEALGHSSCSWSVCVYKCS